MSRQRGGDERFGPARYPEDKQRDALRLVLFDRILHANPLKRDNEPVDLLAELDYFRVDEAPCFFYEQVELMLHPFQVLL